MAEQRTSEGKGLHTCIIREERGSTASRTTVITDDRIITLDGCLPPMQAPIADYESGVRVVMEGITSMIATGKASTYTFNITGRYDESP